MLAKEVVIYTTPTCSKCHMAKDYLSKEGVPYTEYNVVGDRQRAMELIRETGQMKVPVIVIDDEVLVGFDQTKIEELLAE